MNLVDFNGKYFRADEPVFLASNKSYRYGDGFFETMRVTGGEINYGELHADRFFSSAERLGMLLPALLTRDKFREIILQCCRKNKVEKSARVRFSVFRGNGGILEGDDQACWLIEAWPLDGITPAWNENGLVLGIFEDARKTADVFSSIKTASFLPYSLAARFAKKNQWNDSLLLNQHGRPCDTSIASIFLVKDGKLITPSLDEGCIDGVMRRHIIGVAADNGIILEERPVAIDEPGAADEIFLSNTIRGIRWVGRMGDQLYGNSFTRHLHSILFR